MTKILSPNKHFSGIIATVEFVKGVGSCDDSYLLSYFKRKGYTVDEDKKQLEKVKVVKAETPKQVNIKDMTYPELKKLAKEKGIKGNFKKDELIEKLVGE